MGHTVVVEGVWLFSNQNTDFYEDGQILESDPKLTKFWNIITIFFEKKNEYRIWRNLFFILRIDMSIRLHNSCAIDLQFQLQALGLQMILK